MRHRASYLIGLLLIAMFGFGVFGAYAQDDDPAQPEPEATAEPTSEPTPEASQPTEQTYVVQAGDNLFRIALRFGVSLNELAAANNIANPRLIFVGQTLTIPGQLPTTEPPITPVPEEPTPPPAVHTVQVGETLNRIAARYNTTISAIQAINTIPNPNLVYVGQQINIPGAADAPPPPSDQDAGDVALQPVAPGQDVMPDADFAYGIDVYFDGQNVDALTAQIGQLGVDWVKVRVDWRVLEPEQGTLDFQSLDAVVNALEAADINMMMTITNAPSWARTSIDENGPPDDLNNFFTFVNTVAERYAGRVQAYQIWDEPNLRRNWNCERRMCDTDYLFMLGESFALIKDIDPDALVISAGLAPTRFNDRINAVDDRLYLETLLSRGLDTVVDGIGIHPGGEANPPDAVCCDQPPGVESHYENDSFYFQDNLTAYRDLIVRYGASDIPLWVTKFGWGTAEDIASPPSNPNQPHYAINYTSLSEQAIYVPRAYAIGQDSGYVGPMFLHNLNGCDITTQGGLPELCYTSLVSPNGTNRPVYTAVQAIDKAQVTQSQPEPEQTPSPPGAGDESEGAADGAPDGSVIEPIPFDEATEEPTPESNQG